MPAGGMEAEAGGRLFINATNVHSGGGAALLNPVLRAVPADSDIVALLDTRMHLPADLPSNITIRRVAPTIAGRVLSDRWLAAEAQANDRIFCFGNLPPLFVPRCKTSVFVQNRFLAGRAAMDGLPFRVRLRLQLERLWLAMAARHADIFIVQTPSMKRELAGAAWARGRPVVVAPFAELAPTTPAVPVAKDWDFVYVASGDAHKNHLRLLEAWRLLAAEGIRPSLRLTIDAAAFPALCARVDAEATQYGLDVVNLGLQPHAEMPALYARSRALIFPSTLESFGIPLIEARNAGLFILAAELDYVRDVVEPDESFDPTSALSMARAVRRWLGRPDEHSRLLDAADFIARIWGAG
ncbi:MAG: glycosyltransferase [Candidatus Devosia euplotis]|nr:glycosyltransferase [Candidatus Devosia euplotis]